MIYPLFVRSVTRGGGSYVTYRKLVGVETLCKGIQISLSKSKSHGFRLIQTIADIRSIRGNQIIIIRLFQRLLFIVCFGLAESKHKDICSVAFCGFLGKDIWVK